MGLIAYVKRHSNMQSYDTSLVNLLNDLGYTVSVLDEADVMSQNYKEIGLLIVGAPGTNYTGTSLNLNDLPVHIISMCRHTSRVALGMAGSSGTATVNQFRTVYTDHPIISAIGNPTSISLPSQMTHELWSLPAGTTLIMQNSSSGRAGLAERTADEYTRIHFGYHRFDTNSTELDALMEAVVDYIGVQVITFKPEGTFEYRRGLHDGLVLDSTIQWEQETPEGTAVTVYTSLLDDPATEAIDWVLQPYSASSIQSVPTGLVLEKNVFALKVVLETTDPYARPSVSNMQFAIPIEEDAKKIRLALGTSLRDTLGDVTVSYDQSIGNLLGLGGAVESFEKSFKPDALNLNPTRVGTHEQVTANINTAVSLMEVVHKKGTLEENINVGIDLLLEATQVGNQPL